MVEKFKILNAMLIAVAMIASCTDNKSKDQAKLVSDLISKKSQLPNVEKPKIPMCSKFPEDERKFIQELCEMNPVFVHASRSQSKTARITFCSPDFFENSDEYLVPYKEFFTTLSPDGNGMNYLGEQFTDGMLTFSKRDDQCHVHSINLYNWPSTIPSSISNLKFLQNFSANIKNQDLPGSIQNLTHLKRFHIQGHRHTIALPAWIKRMTELESIDVNQVTFPSDPDLFKPMKKLKRVYVYQPEAYKTLPTKNLNKLESLSIMKNDIDSIPNWVFNLNNLTTLEIKYSKLSNISDKLCKLKQLRDLDLEENQITELPECLTNLKALKYLNVRKNKLRHLPIKIGELKNLTSLYFKQNDIEHLPSSFELFSKNGSLKYIDFPDSLSEKDKQLISTVKDQLRFAGEGGSPMSRSRVVAALDSQNMILEGAHTQDQVLKVVAAYMGQIEYCYERQLQKEPNLKGKVSVNFEIDKMGAVNSSKVSNSTMNNPAMESCVASVFKRMPYPSTGSITKLTLPIVFEQAQ